MARRGEAAEMPQLKWHFLSGQQVFFDIF